VRPLISPLIREPRLDKGNFSYCVPFVPCDHTRGRFAIETCASFKLRKLGDETSRDLRGGRVPVCTENSNPNVVVMQSTENCV
jgi:hypothetical protein